MEILGVFFLRKRKLSGKLVGRLRCVHVPEQGGEVGKDGGGGFN